MNSNYSPQNVPCSHTRVSLTTQAIRNPSITSALSFPKDMMLPVQLRLGDCEHYREQRLHPVGVLTGHLFRAGCKMRWPGN